MSKVWRALLQWPCSRASIAAWGRGYAAGHRAGRATGERAGRRDMALRIEVLLGDGALRAPHSGRLLIAEKLIEKVRSLVDDE